MTKSSALPSSCLLPFAILQPVHLVMKNTAITSEGPHSLPSFVQFNATTHQITSSSVPFGSQSQDCCWFPICQTQSIFNTEAGPGEWTEQRQRRHAGFTLDLTDCERRRSANNMGKSLAGTCFLALQEFG